ncbi:MAG: 2,3-bisphosphoglycerate-dependent phosphoglycerate mutase [Gaiellaceae bacterium]|jgi:probable phosphoglycerate mutase|nr:2,3-bisphosphoglycerate-dependent phosphoglycerate mutase [Gaiellaceae bacterium]
MLETVILARHGESAYSAQGLVNGDPSVRVPLTEKGRAEARALGEALRDRQIDLCVTSDFERAQETADEALAGRDIPRLVVPELGDIRMGGFEGKTLEAYRAWAHVRPPDEVEPGGGESRVQALQRFLKGYAVVAARPEQTVLVISHGLPILYVLRAAEGHDPAASMGQAEYAHPYELTGDEFRRALARLEHWLLAPAW